MCENKVLVQTNPIAGQLLIKNSHNVRATSIWTAHRYGISAQCTLSNGVYKVLFLDWRFLRACNLQKIGSARDVGITWRFPSIFVTGGDEGLLLIASSLVPLRWLLCFEIMYSRIFNIRKIVQIIILINKEELLFRISGFRCLLKVPSWYLENPQKNNLALWNKVQIPHYGSAGSRIFWASLRRSED